MMSTEKYIINDSLSVRDALARLNELSSDILTLLVVDSGKKLVGSITDGDIRRALIGGAELSDLVTRVLHPHPFVLHDTGFTTEDMRTIRKKRLELVPVVDKEGRITRVYNFRDKRTILPVDAVVMAGGRGERLRPLTDSVPKPLLPLGNKPIIEYNIDNLLYFGIDKITISVRYLGEQIKAYFGDGSQKGATIGYVEEGIPLGTIGALGEISEFDNEVVLVMNSDLFTNIDFEEFYLHFSESGADMSVASVPYNISIPYAVMQTSDGLIHSFEEKPTYTYFSNGGIYLIKKSVIDKYIQKGCRCDATDLMQRLIDDRKKVTYFPVVGYWIDIGKPEDYKKAKEFIKYLKTE
ncbi:nucleotidyltransferase family protein [Coprobacter tertius]|uniref:Nucleotidyltransferase family protein n=1 Tax=Coprobacter tertius TaxID=2944915 RepID=A0ABT1MFE6_9BACT|nr:nucleotidyltransferase family protein [Coprobacter tertius]MCP9610601.1 nucleotidyltransferase family protein [Coprobacter tertius]